MQMKLFLQHLLSSGHTYMYVYITLAQSTRYINHHLPAAAIPLVSTHTHVMCQDTTLMSC